MGIAAHPEQFWFDAAVADVILVEIANSRGAQLFEY